MIYHLYESKYGVIQIFIENKSIVNMTMKELDFKSPAFIKQANNLATKEEVEILNNTIEQLNSYFNGSLKTFSLPLKFECSPFSKRVYFAVLNTDYGKTYSYKDIASLAGSDKAFRAVGTAMKNNPFAMIIPCHRVIKSNGEYGRYFNNDNLKEKLINFEKENIQ